MNWNTLLEIKGVMFGQGLPKICLPLTGQGFPALLSQAQQMASLPGDLYEWRMDGFYGDVLQTLPLLQDALGDKPLLCTLRTKQEGGQVEVSPEEYEAQLTALLETGDVDLIDIELSCGEERVTRLVKLAHSRGTAAVVSKHDFEKTPPKEEISATLVRMKELGADLPKYAVMPRDPGDVLALLEATWQASRRIGPVISMSMGELGKLTRAAGGVFGSCMTFGVGVQVSAPGQIGAEDLRAILEDLQPYDGNPLR